MRTGARHHIETLARVLSTAPGASTDRDVELVNLALCDQGATHMLVAADGLPHDADWLVSWAQALPSPVSRANLMLVASLRATSLRQAGAILHEVDGNAASARVMLRLLCATVEANDWDCWTLMVESLREVGDDAVEEFVQS